MQKYNKYKKQYGIDQQTNKSIDKLYRKSMILYVIFLLSIWMKRKMNLFL